MVGISAMNWCPISTKNCTDIFVKSNNSRNVRQYVAQQICRPTSATVYANPPNGEFFPEKEPSNLALRHAPFDAAAERNNGMERKREKISFAF